MLRSWAQIRPDERRDSLLAFATLFGFIAAHVLLETARDALFLARVPAERLPFVYIGVAITALMVNWLQPQVRAGGRALACFLLGAAVVTCAFWPLSTMEATAPLYLLYIWSGVLATVFLTRLWLLLGGRFTVTQAKRVYAFIGAGSVLGAIAGTAVAGLLSAWLPAAALLIASSVGLALCAMGAYALRSTVDARPVRGEHPIREVRRTLRQTYVRRVGALILVSTVAFTLVDYLFKSVAAREVAAQDLASFFALVYFAFNLLSLLVQVSVVRPLVRSLNIGGVLAILPVFLLFGAVGAAVFGGLVATLLMKAPDGALRYSLHRTATELLYVPMNERLRATAKALIDILGQRGGQALASLLILALLAAGAGERVLLAALAACAVLWGFLAGGLRGPYLELFRKTLRRSALQRRIDLPALDLSSLESLMEALNSQRPAEVRVALELLEEEGRVALIPALILYHPSTEVVVAALEIFARAKRQDFLHFVPRLLRHEAPEVRAACLRAMSSLGSEPQLLREHLEADCPVVKATALVGLIAAGQHDSEESDALHEMVEHGSALARAAVARAVEQRPSMLFEDVLLRLADTDDPEVMDAVLRAMGRAPSARYLHVLTQSLSRRQLRARARAALVQLGPTALAFLEGALHDQDLAPEIRRHLPRTIMRFAPERAAVILLERLPEEPDGIVRYKILRALGRLRTDDPLLPLNAEVLHRAARDTVMAIYRMIHWRIVLQRGADRVPQRATHAQWLLIELLRDKEVNAIERLFRVLGLIHPKEDLAALYRAIRSSRRIAKASAQELLGHVLEAPLKEPVLALLEELPDEERLELAGDFYRPPTYTYEQLLVVLLDTPSESVRSLAVHHVGELGLSELEPRIEALQVQAPSFLAGVVRRTLSSLRPPPAASESGP